MARKMKKATNVITPKYGGAVILHKKAKVCHDDGTYMEYGTDRKYTHASINLGIIESNEIIDTDTAFKIMARDFGIAGFNDIQEILTEKQFKKVVDGLAKKYDLTPED